MRTVAGLMKAIRISLAVIFACAIDVAVGSWFYSFCPWNPGNNWLHMNSLSDHIFFISTGVCIAFVFFAIDYLLIKAASDPEAW